MANLTAPFVAIIVTSIGKRCLRAKNVSEVELMALVEVYRPDTEPELIAVVAMLEAYGIPCLIDNAGFGSLYPGPQIDSYNARTVRVPKEKQALALQLIAEFRGAPATHAPSSPTSSKLRAFLEMILFGWFIPGRRDAKTRK
jgi:hypothetical protein